MKRILALLPLTAFVGCASLSSYQEARVTEKGKAELFFGATGYQDDLEKVDVSFTSANSGTIDTTDPLYLQESTVPMGSETHAGEDVAIYADGPRAHLFRGTLEQNVIYHVMADALGY